MFCFATFSRDIVCIAQSLYDYAHAVYQSIFCVTSRKGLLTNAGQGNALCHTT